MPQQYDPITFEVDHIVPAKLHGLAVAANLALACFHCNNAKGPNIAGIDPETGNRAYLFHPRNDPWPESFAWDGARARGRTPNGRPTDGQRLTCSRSTDMTASSSENRSCRKVSFLPRESESPVVRSD